MTSKSSRYSTVERTQRQATRLRLSERQYSLLHWLRAELHRRQRAGDTKGVPYPELVRAAAIDKASVTAHLRYLIQKGLVLVTLPRGGWARYVTLTEKGEAQAQTPPKETRKARQRGALVDFSSPESSQDSERPSLARRERRQWSRQKDRDRRTRRRKTEE